MAYFRPGKPIRLHPADVADAAAIASAVSYSVFFRKSPAEKFSEPACDLAAARVIETRLNTEHGANGRRALIYAVMQDGRHFPLSA